MRTTLTLDPDVAAQLEQLRRRDDRPFKELVNDVLRAGLAQPTPSSGQTAGPYTRPTSLGSTLLPDVDDVAATLAIAEGEHFR